jgi:Protein kinase domain
MWSFVTRRCRIRSHRDNLLWLAMGTTTTICVVATTGISNELKNDDDINNTEQQLVYTSVCDRSNVYPRRIFPFYATVACEPLILQQQVSSLRRHQTVQQMEKTSTKKSLKEQYNVDWVNPLGEGSFGSVHTAIHRETGEVVAVKKISKKFTDNVSFQREMDALLHIRQSGGHPNICGLRENYDEGQHYYLVLDYVSGGEMFDHLCLQGPYSEADAARLIQETASALAYLHGINIVHGDIKPENLMLSSKHSSDAIIKLVDFGCAQVTHGDDVTKRLKSVGNCMNEGVARTPAYCPPEVLESVRKNGGGRIDPSFDMWVCDLWVQILFVYD